jgi:hypothetical protein
MELGRAMNSAFEAWQQSQPRAPAYEVLSLHATTVHVPPAAAAVYHALPDAVQTLLTDPNYHTIFLAPCGVSVNLPWELVQVPERSDAGSAPSSHYVGLQRLLPRTRGLGELSEVLQRQPMRGGNGITVPHATVTRTRGRHGARAVVVGNPLHTGVASLPHAQRRCHSLGSMVAPARFSFGSR